MMAARATPVPPITSTTMSICGSVTTCITLSVTGMLGPTIRRARSTSRAATHAISMRRPARRVISSRLRSRTWYVPPPTVPIPSSPTLTGFKHTYFPADAGECCERSIHVVLFQCCAHLHANARGSLGNDRKSEACYENALLQETIAERDRKGRLTDDNGNDRALRGQRSEACGFEAGAKVAHVLVQLANELGMCIEIIDRCQRAARDGRRQRV